MKVLLVAPLCSRDVYRRSVPEKLRTGQAMQKFYRLLAGGLAENGVAVQVLSAPPVERLSGSRAYRPAPDHEDSVAFFYSLTLRPRALGRVVRLFETAWRVWRYARTECDAVLADPMNVLPFIAAWLGTHLARTPLVGIVTDVPTFYAGSVGKKKSLPLRVSEQIMTKADAYVLLTPQMNKLVNPRARPSVVVEGIAQPAEPVQLQQRGEAAPHVMLYAGGIRAAYGLDLLLSAFVDVNHPDWEFHIYGGGPFASEVEALAEESAHVKYRGVKDNEVVLEAQRRASILVNPRLSGHEYTHYSFPSKIIEYMTSGTPTLTTRLPGIPESYVPYLLFFDDETKEGMSETLVRIFRMPEGERTALGDAACSWIAETKSPKAQAGLVTGLLRQVTCASDGDRSR